MQAPSITAITFDKDVYSPGQQITVTIEYISGTSENTQVLNGTATDSLTGRSGSLQVTFIVETDDLTSISLSDSGNRTWTRIFQDGSTATFQAVA